MRTSTKLGSFISAAAVTALTAGLLAVPAQAVTPHPVLVVGGAGGSKVQAASGLVMSGLTAQSGINTITLPASAHNEIADGSVTGLLDAGAVTTREEAEQVGPGADITAKAHTANVSLLGGLLKLDAVDTTSTASYDGTSLSSNSSTTFLGIKITNVDLPVNIPQNFKVKIPNVALIVLNYNSVYNAGNTVATIGAGAFVQLLGKYGDTPLGTRIFLNLTFSALSTHVPNTPEIVGGRAYGSQLTLHALNIIGIESGPTAQQTIAGSGTNGVKKTNSTASVLIPHVLHTSVVQTTVEGDVTTTSGHVQTTASVARLSLLGGLITARSLRAVSSVTARPNGTVVVAGHATFLGLNIGGHAYPINPDANTVVNVAGLGRVTINEVAKNGFAVTVRALDIVLSTARAGLPVGARIELAVASSYVLS